MKKLILSLAFLFIAVAAYSQFNLGIKVGYNSSLSFSSIGSGITYNHKNVFQELGNNFHAGAFARVHFGKVYIQPELLYSIQKKNYTFDINNLPSAENMIKISTIDVPVLLGYRIFDFKIANIRAFLGPKFRFNAGSDVKFSNLKADVDGAKVGLDVGVGVDVLMLTFDVRYSLIGDMYQTPAEMKNGLKSSTFVFSLGWKIF